MLHLTKTRTGVAVDPPQNPNGGVQGDGPLRTVDTTEAASEQAVVGMVRQKRKALPPQETLGEGTAEPTPEMGKDREAIGGIDEMSTSLRRGNRINPVAGTGGLEHLVPRWLAMEAISTETAYEEPKKSFTELLLELQSRDASVGR